MAPIKIPEKEARYICLAQPRAKTSTHLRFLRLRLQFLPVLLAVLVLFGFRIFTFQIVLIQLLLQSFLAAQLLLRQPLQVPIVLLLSVSLTNALTSQSLR